MKFEQGKISVTIEKIIKEISSISESLLLRPDFRQPILATYMARIKSLDWKTFYVSQISDSVCKAFHYNVLG